MTNAESPNPTAPANHPQPFCAAQSLRLPPESAALSPSAEKTRSPHKLHPAPPRAVFSSPAPVNRLSSPTNPATLSASGSPLPTNIALQPCHAPPPAGGPPRTLPLPQNSVPSPRIHASSHSETPE